MMMEKKRETMTDFQFKALLSMVMDILDRSKDLDDAKDALRKYIEI